MKTKLLILLGIILAGLSAFAVAQNQSVSTWRQDLQNVNASKENLPDDVSELLASMQGIQAEESAYLDDDKAIYVSLPNDLNEKTSRRKIADNVEHVFDQKGSIVLFGKNPVMDGETGGYPLWVTDTKSGVLLNLDVGVVNSATISPSGKTIAVSFLNSFKISLFSKDGVFLKQIAEHGINPVFSQDGKLLAYAKLANDDLGSGLGIAIYNLERGNETLVTNDKEDWEPLVFSEDGRKFYFNSGRGQGRIEDQYKGAPFQTPLWTVDLVSGKVKQLNNRGVDGAIIFVPQGAFVSSDGSTMIADSGSGISILAFDNKGDVSSVKILANGTKPKWLKQDEIIAYRAQGFKGKYWEFVSVK